VRTDPEAKGLGRELREGQAGPQMRPHQRHSKAEPKAPTTSSAVSKERVLNMMPLMEACMADKSPADTMAQREERVIKLLAAFSEHGVQVF
jgi:hypothetical protein